jgi:hypothetical protein
MKKLIILFVGITLLFAGCSDDKLVAPDFDGNVQPNADLKEANKKIVPIPNLTGIGYLTFSPTSPTNFWNGTIDFGDYGEYSIAFFTFPPRDRSQVVIFDEDFIIYELGTDWSIPGNVVLKGSTKGTLVYANKLPDPAKYQSNGVITEANGPFEMCADRPVHIKGTVFYSQSGPPTAVGVIRIN